MNAADASGCKHPDASPVRGKHRGRDGGRCVPAAGEMKGQVAQVYLRHTGRCGQPFELA